jgi:protein-tyrosine phosphatase
MSARCPTAATVRLQALGFPVGPEVRFPLRAVPEDFHRAARVIALKEAEHRPLLMERFPGWAERVEYWHIHDVDGASPKEALAVIEREVKALIEVMRTGAR